MDNLDDLVAQIPMDQVAGALGVDREEAERAVRSSLPALVAGMKANADDPAGAASLGEALGQHRFQLQNNVDLLDVDADDGDKIVQHVFGEQRAQVVDRLGGLGGLGGTGDGSGLIAKLLPILAPIVMAWLAKRVSGAAPQAPEAPGSQGDAPFGGGGLGDILGGLLGGEGGGLGDLLGGLLGGGRR